MAGHQCHDKSSEIIECAAATAEIQVNRDDSTTRSADATDGGLPPGSLLKRSQAARVLGVSTSTVRRMEGRALQPIIGADGVRLFRREEVEELTVRRVVEPPQRPDDFDGEVAAAVFALLDDGVTPIEIVKRTHLDPRAVSAVQRHWARMQGGLFVEAAHLRIIEELDWMVGEFPITDSETLLRNLKQSGPRDCARCKRREPRVCVRCAETLSRDAATRIAKAEQRSGAAKQRARHLRAEESLAGRRSEARTGGTQSTPLRSPHAPGESGSTAR